MIDRLLQQAIAQWLSPKYEEEFSNYSYGFRESRNAHQAVLQTQVNLNDGYEWVIELDLEKFFDRVNHDKLMGLLTKKISDKRTLKLIPPHIYFMAIYCSTQEKVRSRKSMRLKRR